MVPLVEFPELVQHYAPCFKRVFSPEAFLEFERYVSGLIVSENKTVDGINRLFVHESRNQSSLNRLLTASPFALEDLNQARLDLLAQLPGTQLKPQGVFSIDDTLLIHFGHHFEKIAQLFDHVSGAYVWAHDLVTLHYSDDATDYPVRFQVWEPVDVAHLEQGLRDAQIPLKAAKEALKTSAPHKWRGYLMGVWQRRQKQQPALRTLYESKLKIAEQLLQQWVAQHPNEQRPVTFDNWFTQAEFCRYLDETLKLPYVGTLAESDTVHLKKGTHTLHEFAERLKHEHLDALAAKGKAVFQKITIPYKGTTETYYSYCHTHQVHAFGKQRLVINYRRADLSDPPMFLVSNRLDWNAVGLTRIRRHRWPVEVYHEEGKAEGLDQYQVRDFGAIQRHVALVAVLYSILRAAPHDPALHTELQRQLKITLADSPAAWRREAQAHALWSLGLFLSAGIAHGQTVTEVLTPLVRAMCRV